ncbi:MAG: hypothetical protein RL091_1948 [Verrucomicrobiota bacterium]
MVLLFIKGALAFLSIVREPDSLFSGPGEFHLMVTGPSDYSVWHHSTASIDGVYSVREPKLPDGARIIVEHGGALVPTRAYGGATVSGASSGDKHSILSFRATEPGDYLIKVTGFEDCHAFSVTRGNGLAPLFGVVGWIFSGVFAAITVLFFLILALTRKFPKPAAPPVAPG